MTTPSKLNAPTLNHSVQRTHYFEPLHIEGQLPSDLRGTLWRAGPGLLKRFGHTISHPFEADGVITGVRFGQTALGASRLVESEGYRDEQRLGRPLYGSTAPLYRRIHNNLRGKIKHTGNTNVLAWQGRLFALMEAGKPVEMDPLNLTTHGSQDLGVIKGAFSAHPHRVEALKTTFNFGLRGKYVDLYALPDSGSARYLGAIKLPWIGLVHDFMVTQHYMIFFLGPVKLALWRALLGERDFGKYFYWDDQAGSRVVIVPLSNPYAYQQLEVDPFWVWHFANAYEEGEHIVIDACRHDDFSAFYAPSDIPPSARPPTLWRYRINPVQGSFNGEPLSQFACEFPSVNQRVSGAKHRYVWLQTFADSVGNGGLARFDTAQLSYDRWFAPEGHLGSEPVFVATRSGEAAGYVLQLLQDPHVGRSYLAVLEAERIAAGPLAKIWFEQRIPMTFHGTFVADAYLAPASQRARRRDARTLGL